MPCGSFQLLIPLDEMVPVICAELRVMRLLPAPDGSSTMSRSHPCIRNGPMLAWSHVQGTTLFQDLPSIGDPHPSRVSSHEAQEPVLRLDEPYPSSSIHLPTRPYRIPAGRLPTQRMPIIVTQLGKGDSGDRSSRITGSKWHGATTMDQAHPSTCAAWLQHALHSANIPTVEGVGAAHIQCIREVFMSASPDKMA